MVEFFIEYGNVETLYFENENTLFIYSATTAENHPNASGKTLTTKVQLTLAQAQVYESAFAIANEPIYYQEVIAAVVNQKVDVYIYPTNNVTDPIINQKVDVYFYPNNNVTVPVINQEVQIQFYADGNVTEPDPLAVYQEVKIEFYPDGNVSDVIDPVVVDGFKFWFGMSGKKRYGKGLSKRISF